MMPSTQATRWFLCALMVTATAACAEPPQVDQAPPSASAEAPTQGLGWGSGDSSAAPTEAKATQAASKPSAQEPVQAEPVKALAAPAVQAAPAASKASPAVVISKPLAGIKAKSFSGPPQSTVTLLAAPAQAAPPAKPAAPAPVVPTATLARLASAGQAAPSADITGWQSSATPSANNTDTASQNEATPGDEPKAVVAAATSAQREAEETHDAATTPAEARWDDPFTPPDDDGDPNIDVPHPVRQPGQLLAPRTINDLVSSHACSTAMTTRINAQLAAQMNCMRRNIFTSVTDIPNVSLGQAANPFLQSHAADALRKTAAKHPETTFNINSSWRSVVQQHILKRWEGSCGISIAADPGTSNHESGLSIDVPRQTTREFRDALRRAGWTWYCDEHHGGRQRGCRDVPHHTWKRGVDVRALSVRAFQKLWNHAHPEDTIRVTGEYNTETARRIDRTPLEGFASGTTCGNSALTFYGGEEAGGQDPVQTPERYLLDTMFIAPLTELAFLTVE